MSHLTHFPHCIFKLFHAPLAICKPFDDISGCWWFLIFLVLFPYFSTILFSNFLIHFACLMIYLARVLPIFIIRKHFDDISGAGFEWSDPDLCTGERLPLFYFPQHKNSALMNRPLLCHASDQGTPRRGFVKITWNCTHGCQFNSRT